MIEEEESKAVYAVNAGMTEFGIPFRFIRREHIKVFHDGSEEYVYGRDYVVNGVTENGGKSYVHGSVVFAEAPDCVIAIVRRVPIEQTTDYVVNGDLPAETLEGDLDYLTMEVQQISEVLGRCLKVGETSLENPEEVLNDILEFTANKAVMEAIKDICILSAESAANSAAMASLCQVFMASVMTELTGNPDYLNGAVNVLQEVWEAKGAIEAAAAVALGDIQDTKEIAVAAMNEAANTIKSNTNESLTEMAESSLLSTTQQLNAEVSAAIGADGVFQAAVTAARETIAGDLSGAETAIGAALSRAEGVVDGYVSAAQETVNGAINDWTQIKEAALAAGNAALAALAEAKLAALADIQTEVGNAQGYSNTALSYRDTTYSHLQAALAAAQNAANSEAAALAYKNDINGIVNETLTVHNVSLASHAAGFNHDVILHNTTGGTTYKIWLRNDGTNFYILVSDANGASWNGNTPIKVSLASGNKVTIGTALEASSSLSVTGNIIGYSAMSVSGALNCASAIVSGALNCASAAVTGNMTADTLTIRNVTASGSISGASATVSGGMTADTLTVRDLTVSGTLNGHVSGSVRYPNYNNKTDVTAAWAVSGEKPAGTWTAPEDGWLLLWMSVSYGQKMLFTSSGEQVISFGLTSPPSTAGILNAVPIPVTGGETYQLRYVTGVLPSATMDPTTSTLIDPDRAIFIAERGVSQAAGVGA